ncbi:MAG TPA: 50S ribosomal protein L21, partial [Actinomycetota bacterium]
QMYAVIKTGGKQHKVRPGDVIEVEYMDVDPGSAVEFEPILVMDDKNRPHVGKSLGNAKVVATLVGDKKADKIKVVKYRAKSGYKRNQGHRQRMTVLEIQEVKLGGRAGKKDEEETKPAAKKPAAKKSTRKKAAAKKTSAKKSSAKKSSKKSASKKPSSRKKAT